MLCRSGDELVFEDGRRRKGGWKNKPSWISGITLLLYSVICRNCLKGMALAISCARTAKYLGCKPAKNYHLRKNAPNKTGTKSGGLGASLSGRSTPGTLSLRYGNRPDNAMLFCSRHDVVHLYLSYSLYSTTGTPSFSLSSFTCCSTESYSYTAAAWQTSFCTFCIPFARSYQGYGRPGQHHIFSLLFRWIRITSTIWLLTLLIRWIRISLTATTNPNPTQFFHFHQVSTSRYLFASSQ